MDFQTPMLAYRTLLSKQYFSDVTMWSSRDAAKSEAEKLVKRESA
jgi:hypothetical protein